jgi:tetratricopeptide (TPR) repeat protein
MSCFHRSGRNSEGQSIEVHNGNVVGSGPNATFNAPVNVGPNAKEVTQQVAAAQNERYEKILAELAREKGVEPAPLRSVLAKLGQAGVKDEDIPKRLDAAADELIKLRAEVERFQQGPPALAAIAQEAQNLINKGDLEGARRALRHGREAARAQRNDSSRNEARFLGLDARVDDLQLAYKSAAEKYAEAAGLVAPFDPKQQWEYIFSQADDLYKQGHEFGDNAALAEAIDLYRRDLSLAPRSERPFDWAMTQMRLGLALFRLGERQGGTARLEEAVAAYREALQEWTRARVPLQWAGTQMNLGTALGALGVRENGTARLEEAVAAYREALQEWTRERVPLEWAGTQNNLGGALEALGERERGTARLEEAVAAFREALQEGTRERVPLQWAFTQMDLALVYCALFDKDHQPRQLDDAIEAADGALEEFHKAKAAFYIEKAESQRAKIVAMKDKAVSLR